MGYCCEVSLWILDKHQRDLFLGQGGRSPGSCRIAADHRDGVGVFYPVSARNPAELWSHSLEVMPRNPWTDPLFPGPGDPELKVLTSFFFFSYLNVVYFFLFVVNFVIHWNETAMGLHVFPIPIPPPTSLSTRSP